MTGAATASGDCFVITSAGNVLHGLVINRCPYCGILVAPASATRNTVSGHFIGTDATGTAALGNTHGVYIARAAQDNTIGGDKNGTSSRATAAPGCGF